MMLFLKSEKMLSAFLEIVKTRKLYILLCLLITISWAITLQNEYGILTPNFVSSSPFGADFLDEASLHRKVISEGIFSTGSPDGGSIELLFESIFSNSIYSNTFQEHSLNNKYQILIFIKSFLNSPLFIAILMVTLSVMFIRLIKNHTSKSTELIVSFIWILSCSIAWLIMKDGTYSWSAIKIFYVMLPACALIFSIFVSELNQKQSWIKNSIYSLCLISFFIHNVFFEKININNSYRSEFVYKYGFKRELIDTLNEKDINKNEVLWIIRGEHGSFLPFLWNKGHYWEYKWYDSGSFYDLHNAKNELEILESLNKHHIKYILTSSKEELQKYYLTPYSKSYPEKLIYDLVNENHKYLKILYEEKKYKGLEMKLYEILNI